MLGEPLCRHKCKDKEVSVRKCGRFGCTVVKKKASGNLNQKQYLECYLKRLAPLYLRHHPTEPDLTVLEDNDGSHGTRSEDNDCARAKKHLAESLRIYFIANTRVSINQAQTSLGLIVRFQTNKQRTSLSTTNQAVARINQSSSPCDSNRRSLCKHPCSRPAIP